MAPEVIRVEVRRGLLGFKKRRALLQNGEEIQINNVGSVLNSNGTIWVRDERLDGQNVRIERSQWVIGGSSTDRFTYKQNKGKHFSYFLPSYSGVELKISTPSMRVKASRF